MRLGRSLLVFVGLHAISAYGYLTCPPTEADPSTPSDCSNWIVADPGITCSDIAQANGLNLLDFELFYNPSVGTACKLNPGQSYCVERNFGQSGPLLSTGTAISPTPTSPANGVITPTPTQPGMVGNCNKFDHVTQGDICTSVASRNGIPLSDFEKWNSGVGSDCSKMWANVYVCVGVIGGSTSLPTTTTWATTPTTTTAGNGIATPTPIQPGMIQNCDKFYYVQPGDACAAIAINSGISLSQFYNWNAGVGSNCQSLWANAYVCVHVFS